MPIDLQERLFKGLLAAALLGAFGVLILLPPEDIPLPACAFHSLTGASCLTCGLTRSLSALSHGALHASIGHHAMGPAFFIGALLLFYLCSFEAVSGRRIAIRIPGRERKRILVVLAVLWLFQWGIKLLSELTEKAT